MRPAICLLFLFLLVTLVFGFDCSSLDDVEGCEALDEVDEGLIAGLIYTNRSFPDHKFVYGYNSEIEVSDAPERTLYHYKGIISKAWLDIFTIMPSVKFNGSLFVPSSVVVRSGYGYDIQLPQDYYNPSQSDGATCKILYSLGGESSSFELMKNGQLIGDTEVVIASVEEDSLFEARWGIAATQKEEKYVWSRYCCKWKDEVCRRYCFDCNYLATTYKTYNLEINDQEEVSYYGHVPVADFRFISRYYGSSKGNLSKDNDTSITLRFNNSYYKEQEYQFGAEFSKEPYYFLTITAEKQETRESKNLILDGSTVFVKDASGCSVEYSDFFSTGIKQCNESFKGEELEEFQKSGLSHSWNLLFTLAVFVFICSLIYAGVRKYWGKALIPVTLLFILVPSVYADDCGLTNLASCLPGKMYDFFIGLLNAPLQPLLSLTRSLLENAPYIDLFHGLWAIMVYCISLFYGLLFMYSGLQFLFSGHNVIRREMAKQWLKNTVIMITLIQASFYLYRLVLEIGAMLTSSVLSMVNEYFFLITADNIVNIGLEFLFLLFYVSALFMTIILLLIRYLIVSFGVIFMPIAIFCYFVPPIKSYGKLILHLLGTFIFITFIDAVIILASSMLIEIPLFENVKILVMIACFSIINTLFIILTLKAIFKAINTSDHAENIAQAVKYIGMIA